MIHQTQNHQDSLRLAGPDTTSLRPSAMPLAFRYRVVKGVRRISGTSYSPGFDAVVEPGRNSQVG